MNLMNKTGNEGCWLLLPFLFFGTLMAKEISQLNVSKLKYVGHNELLLEIILP